MYAIQTTLVYALDIYNKAPATLSSSAVVAYPLHVFLLKTHITKREWLINNGDKIIGFLPVSIPELKAEKKEIR